MQEYFEREITTMEKELRWLKTSVVKSGATVSSIAKSVPYNIPLNLVSSTNANGSALFKLTLREKAVFNPTLDIYYDDITLGPLGDTRRRAVQMYWLNDTQYVLEIGVWGDSNDIATLEGGGSVEMSGTLTVTSTDEFTLEAM